LSNDSLRVDITFVWTEWNEVVNNECTKEEKVLENRTLQRENLRSDVEESSVDSTNAMGHGACTHSVTAAENALHVNHTADGLLPSTDIAVQPFHAIITVSFVV
jgi:hypothetical protein